MKPIPPDFAKGNGLVPAIIQDILSGDVYMLGYMNKQAFVKTKETGTVYFYSRNRKTLWKKGEQSGNTLTVREILTDCDGDTFLVKVTLNGTGVCHTGSRTCFT